MRIKFLFLILIAFFLFSGAKAQINTFVGGNLQGSYSVVRENDASYKPGFGGGLNFYYWEYTYWFIKAGIDYSYKTSSYHDYPDVFGDTYLDYPDPVDINYIQHDISIPLSAYFPLLERQGNYFILVGTLEMAYAITGKLSNPEIGTLQLKGDDIKNRLRTAIGIGAGYQVQLDKNIYLNAFPSYNIDMRADRPFNSIRLTVEVMFGIY